ncbi:hypothetical protein EYR40_002567 [Pleurotus pulmonarius]|nr:hypothetical protein EYR40_002567 [Pleurotus pulmonarius]
MIPALHLIHDAPKQDQDGPDNWDRHYQHSRDVPDEALGMRSELKLPGDAVDSSERCCGHKRASHGCAVKAGARGIAQFCVCVVEPLEDLKMLADDVVMEIQDEPSVKDPGFG